MRIASNYLPHGGAMSCSQRIQKMEENSNGIYSLEGADLQRELPFGTK
jgi:hypothetical protein